MSSTTKMMMKWHIFATIILIQLKTFYCNTIEISSYSKVAKSGNVNEQTSKNIDPPPQIHRAREGVINSDLWIPKTISDASADADTNADANKSTGRSIGDRPFPFPLKNAVYSTYEKPSNHRSSNEPRIVYASPVQHIAQDRFVPHESVDHFLQKNNRNRVKSSPNIKESDREDDNEPDVDRPPSNFKPTIGDYKPPPNLYAFPPNNDALYPAPGDTRKPISVSSYLPPPSGPSNYPIYPGPVISQPASTLHTQVDNSGSVDDTNDMNDMNDNGGSTQDNGNVDSGNPDRPSDDTNLIDRPPPNFVPNKKPDFPSLPYLDSDSHDHHHHDHHHDDHFYDSAPFSPYDDSLKHLHGFDAFPDVILDDHHHDFFDDHHHFHHPPPTLPPPPPPPPSTPPPLPPPEEPEEDPEEQPRVKKYSYFYLSRSLWYIPLYFTVWFTFYVTWLILQSIGRHKVDLPNHTLSRRSIRDLSHKETVDKVNLLTEFVMSQIDDFKEKYL